MMKRKAETIERVTYTLDAGEVEAAILSALIEQAGDVFNKSTEVTVYDDGSASVVTDFRATTTKDIQ